jgi:FAD/FMN-containing dehydrogenase
VLIELSSPSISGLDEVMQALLASGFEAGAATDAAIAASGQQRADIWRLREAMSEVQGKEGGSIKHDVAVPVAAVPELIERGMAAMERLLPGCRPLPFGHMGDGNIHFNISQPAVADKAAFLARWDEANAVIHGLVRELGGSISAEHGIGRLKRKLLPGVKDPVEMALMRTVKAALDPNGVLNPGAVL